MYCFKLLYTSLLFFVICMCSGCSCRCTPYTAPDGFLYISEEYYDSLVYHNELYKIYDSIFTAFDLRHSILYYQN